MNKLELKRAYDEPSKKDGKRILVDRVWPRGKSKEKLAIDHWYKDIAPSSELRKWFNHDPDKFQDFKKKYKEELTSDSKKEVLKQIKSFLSEDKVTLVFGAKDRKHNQAVVLKEIIQEL